MLYKLLNRSQFSYRKINYLIFSQIFLVEFNLGYLSKLSITNLLKRYSCANYIKILFSRRITQIQKHSSEGIHFINEVNNSPQIEIFESLIQSWKNKNYLIIISDERIRNSNKEIQPINILNYYSLKSFLMNLFDFIVLTFIYFKSISYIKKNKWPIFLLYLNLLETAVLVRIIENYFSLMKVNKIVLNTDVHKISRIISIIAKQYNIKTFVIQHGAHGYVDSMLPIVSDYFLSWGDISRRWLIDHGENNEKITAVGSIRGDKFAYKRPQLLRDLTKILIPISPINKNDITKFLSLIKDALEPLDNRFEIVIKLHPSNDSIINPKTIFKNSKHEIKVLKDENIYDLIDKSDIIIFTFSTVGIEAILGGKPVIQYTGYQHAIPDIVPSSYDCFLSFNNIIDLQEIINNYDLINSKLNNYSKFLKDYFGNLDNKSTERIVKFIEEK